MRGQRSGPRPAEVSPRASVVVVNWDGLAMLEQCLAVVVPAAQGAGDEVVVVDNGSRDGSVEWLRRTWPEVTLVQNDRNEGFARAVNQGIAASRGQYIATINNDAVPEAACWLDEPVRALVQDPGLWAVAMCLVFDTARGTVQSAGVAVDRAGAARDRASGTPLAGVAGAEVFGPSAGAALYRRTALAALGGFDEEYFAYYEDVDLAWRARRAGLRCALVPSVIRHQYSATSRRDPNRKAYLLARNRTRLLAKNASAAQLCLGAPRVLLYDLGLVAITAARSRTLAPLRGTLAGLAGLRAAQRHRQALPMLPRTAFENPVPLRRLRRERMKRDALMRAAS